MGIPVDSPPPNAIDRIVEAQHEEGKAIRKEIGNVRKNLDLLLKVTEDLRGNVEDLASVMDAVRVEVGDLKKRVISKADFEKLTNEVGQILSYLEESGQ